MYISEQNISFVDESIVNYDERLAFLKKLWCCIGGGVKYFYLVSINCRQGSNFHRNEIPKLTFRTRELKQPRRRRQQKSHKFAYLTIKNSFFPRFARALFIFLPLWRRSRSFYDAKWPVLQLCGRREHMITKCSILSSYVPSAGSNLIPG